MTLMFIGVPELVLILLAAVLLFGGSRLAGIGKGVGRSIREFKEEIKSDDGDAKSDIVDAEIIQHPEIDKRDS